MKQTSFCETILKKEIQNDSVRCYNKAQIQAINDALIDLDACDSNTAALERIIAKQDTVISKQAALVTLSEKVDSVNTNLSDKLDASLSTQFLKAEMMDKKINKLERQLTWSNVKTTIVSGTLGGTVALLVIVELLKIFKVF